MIPIECPKCGRAGNVPPDKLNARLHCKNCDAVFHLDNSGHVVLGEPGSGKPESHRAMTAAEAKAAPMELGANLAQAWKAIPLAGRAAILVVALGAVLYATGVRLPSFTTTVPTDLLGRATFAADAFIDQSPGRLRKIAAPGTESDAAQWLEKVRATFRHTGPRQQGNMVGIFPEVVKQDPSAKTARILITLLPPNPKPEPAKTEKGYFAPGYLPNGTFALPTIWKQDASNRWRLDGTATLQNANSPPTAAESPTPAPKTRGSGSGTAKKRREER